MRDLMDPLGKISTAMDNTAIVIANVLRETGNGSDGHPGRAYGTIMQAAVCTQICTQIDMPWFSFPEAIVLASYSICLGSYIGRQYSRDVSDARLEVIGPSVVVLWARKERSQGRARKPGQLNS